MATSVSHINMGRDGGIPVGALAGAGDVPDTAYAAGGPSVLDDGLINL